MDMEKLKQWLDLTKQYQSENFWHQVFDQNSTSEELFGPFPQGQQTGRKFQGPTSTFPLCDVYEKDQLLFIEVEVPGLRRDQLDIKLEDNKLVIKSTFKNFQPSIRYFKKERLNKEFEKKIHLPYDIDPRNIKSSLQQGVLTIQCPFEKKQGGVSIQIDEVDESSSPGW
ncbi:Hsp20/alpha crystallin family protein [Falsibacillus pallidus]|uniref:HSP20 family protein n=1 Tax=Falsibacillus pallidus TaxID=493781 RepID=A0A370GHC0_9BACI|nr:Hsp20/alpha crystallin family protein [Falsibacillus pallidus]RDI43172.1 HSP20 family protein [Falsibacillus pallidus]